MSDPTCSWPYRILHNPTALVGIIKKVAEEAHPHVHRSHRSVAPDSHSWPAPSLSPPSAPAPLARPSSRKGRRAPSTSASASSRTSPTPRRSSASRKGSSPRRSARTRSRPRPSTPVPTRSPRCSPARSTSATSARTRASTGTRSRTARPCASSPAPTSGGAYLVVKPEITKVADLKGKKIATPQLGNTQDVALRTWLKSKGLNTDTQGGGDVSIVPHENARTLEAFKQNLIAGAWVPEPWYTRLVNEGGGKVLVDEATLWPEGKYVTTHIIVRTDFLEDNPTSVQAGAPGQPRGDRLHQDQPHARPKPTSPRRFRRSPASRSPPPGHRLVRQPAVHPRPAAPDAAAVGEGRSDGGPAPAAEEAL